MTPRIPDRPLTDAEAGAKLDAEVRRVTRVLMQVRGTPGLYERLRAGNYRMTHGAMEMLLLELAEFWTDESTIEAMRKVRAQSGIVEPPHGGPCDTAVEGDGVCGHPQETHDEFTGSCRGRDWCECGGYTPPGGRAPDPMQSPAPTPIASLP